METIEQSTEQSLGHVTVSVCKERYPREVEVLDQFIERGANLGIISDALKNKFGVSPKSMWLINYARTRLDQKYFYTQVKAIKELAR